MEMLPIAAVLLVGVIVGFINIVSAGGSMLTLPLLIFFGLPSNVANGTNRIAIMFQNTFALYQFHKNGHLNWRLGLLLAVPATIASVYGAGLAVDITHGTFDTLLATFMIIFAVLLILRPQRYIKGKFNPKVSIVILFLAFVLIGIYGGALQAGVGFFIILTLLLLVPQIPMGEMHGIKTLVVTIYISVSTFVFIFNGLVDWKFAVALSLGSALGGALGGKYASVLPDKLLQRILIGAIIFFAIILFIR
ncbi:MAG TPA: sulfite exporter TauE/SafE family protein [Candidatus Salinicoccus stercoripullorum]|uniref:Probable membrane transporter protein n=1 Tax=Candidatus Salinicoccus stercoripullorum TaxID=2838756 RepID=A0A9D1QF39_9STAP|nr:sulfite exporter TauE/SafE family protein [Candidatus Salinicoccus stercoripullorum]